MQKAEFLKGYKKYQLGLLPTEQPHEKTKGLSEIVNMDLEAAIALLKEVDRDALLAFRDYTDQVEELRTQAQQVLQAGHKVFLCGCGATGRLSMLTEFLFREKFESEQVVSFMAGGDVALVHSLEGFEDYPDLGARHLMQMGFSENDLLIATTEGGETPFVIGATEKAAEVSSQPPFFLYCNPTEILVEQVDRSKKVIENNKIKKICLFVGPMALSGSTRMQASTVLQLALGCALVEIDQPVSIIVDELIESFEMMDFSDLVELIAKEHWIYTEGEFLMYMPRDFAITVFTDTTERSPTFSLPSFENNNYRGANPSLCYILLPSAQTPAEAWNKLLLREPKALDWKDIDTQTSSEYMKSFDFSKSSLESREQRVGDVRQYLFEIQCRGEHLLMSLSGVEKTWKLGTYRSLLRHTLLKMLLNTHSTLLMGLMGRYESNIMTWVKPTNAKLVDRATRYIQTLLKEKSISAEYLEIVDRIYENRDHMGPEECIVLKVVQTYTKK